MRSTFRAAALAAGFALTSTAAQAVIVEQGDIDFDGTFKTVDLWFFTTPIDKDLEVVISPIPFGMDVLTGFENPQLLVYRNDGSLDAADFIVGEDDSPGHGLVPVLPLSLAAGDYVFAVSASPLGVGEFGPTIADAAAVPFTYEIGIQQAGGDDGFLTCVLEGQLDGSFARRVLSADNCVEPTQAPEPAALGVLGLAFAGLAALRIRGRPGRRAAPR